MAGILRTQLRNLTIICKPRILAAISPTVRHCKSDSSQAASNKQMTEVFQKMFASDPDEFQSVVYKVEDRVAHITLNRPERFNAIDLFMPWEIEKSVELANLDDSVKVRFHALGLF